MQKTPQTIMLWGWFFIKGCSLMIPLYEWLADYENRVKILPKIEVIEFLLRIKGFLDCDEYARVKAAKTDLEVSPQHPDDYKKYYYEFTNIFTRVNKKTCKFWQDFEREII